jgi:hypothetical protein
MGDELAAERIGRNNATFRTANERLGRLAATQARAPDETLPFVCECLDPACTQVIQVPLAEYRRVRAAPRRFLTAPGHETGAIDVVRVVERHDGYAVTEKTGAAGEVAEELADTDGVR